MKYIYTIILGFILSISIADAQCPNDSNTEATIVAIDALCFGAEDGTISFELKDASDVSLDPSDFNFGLYDGGENDWVYDDIGVSPGGDINPAITLSVSGTVITFSNVPTTKDGIGYTIGSRDTGICGNTLRSYSSGFSGIIISEPTELVASINSITDDCSNSNSGAIDIDVSGGTPDGGGNYIYAWSNSASTQDISGLDDGTYSVTVTDDNGCTAEITGIVVEAGPDAGTAGAADACNNDGAFNLYNVLGGSPEVSGSFTAAVGNPEAVTISQPGDGTTSTANFSGVAAGVYTFTYTVGSTGCPDATADVTITVSEAPDAGTNATVEACEDNNNFDLYAALGGTPDVDGTWTEDVGNPATGILTQSGDGTTGRADLTTATGEYNFTYEVTAPGCSPSTAVLTINVNALPDAGTAGAADACNNDGAFNLYNVLGGSPEVSGSFTAAVGNPEAVTISQPGDGTTSTANFSGVAAGVYTFTYTVGSTGCPDATADVTITVSSLTVSESITNTTGCGVPDGEIALNVTSSFAGDSFTFTWTSPDGFSATTEDITGLEGGDYTVVVTSDNTGCTFTDTYTVVDPVPFTIATTSVDQSQCNVGNGEISVSVSGGAGPFNYYVVDTNTTSEVDRSDADASTNYSFTSLAPGDYEVFVEEGACTQSETFTIDAVTEIVATVDSETPADCGGGANGTITLAITDAGNDFDILVDGVSEGVQTAGTNTYTITGLTLGSYDIIVRDQVTNCEVNITEDVNENATFTIDTETVNDITTCGGSDGSIELTVSGGTPTFTWTGPTGFADPGNTNSITGLDISGTYTVTLEEAGCTVVRNYNITAPTPPTSVAGADSTICLPTLELYADALAADQAGEWQIVSQPAGAAANIIDPTSPTTTLEDLFELGTYELAWILENTITNCSDSDTIVITRKDITVADAGTDQQVCGTTATLAANAADTDETGTWTLISGSGDFAPGEENNPAAEVTNLTIGDNVFEWTISDDNGICDPTSNQVTITAEPLPTAFAGNDESFCDITEIDLSTLDGGNTPPVAENGTIEWTTTSTDGTFNDNTLETPVYTFGTDDITAGAVTLTMTVTGTGACSAEVVSDEVVISINNKPTIEPIADAAICYVDGSSTFDVAATVSNEASVLWSSNGTGTFDDDISPSTFYIPSEADSTAGTVDLTITATGQGACADSVLTFTLDINSIRIDDAVITQTSGCGASDGAIDITVASSEVGDTFDFLWTDSDGNVVSNTDEDLTGLEAGIYNVQITSVTGCTTTATYEVTDPVPFTVTLGTPVDQSTCGTANGEISATVSDNTDNLSYYILDSNGDEVADSRVDDTSDVSYSFTELAPGDYTLVVEENACVANETFTINPAPSIVASVDPANVTPASCGGGNDGSITIDVTDVGNAYTATLTDEDGNETPQNLAAGTTTVLFDALSQGSYSITISDDVTNCEVVINQVVTEDAAFSIDSENVTDIVNCGAAEGAIDLEIVDLVGPTTYSWTGPEGSGFTATTLDINNLSVAGDYQLTIEDNGCVVERTYTISQPAECDYDCEDFRVSPITEAATCLGVDDGKLFFLLRDVNASSPELNFDIKQAGADDATYNRFIVDNIGRGLIIEIDSSFATGTYTVVASDPNLDCVSDTFNINIGTKTTLSATIDIEQPTCTIATGSISANIAGTNDDFEYILYFEGDSLTTNMTGVFADLEEGDYELEFNNQNTSACGLENRTFTIENTAVVDQSAVDINITNPECGEVFGSVSASLNNLPSNYEFILVDGNGDEVARNATGIFNEVPEGTYVMQFENVVDPGACPIADRGGLLIENNGSFTAVASEVEDIVCHGDSDGSAVITLQGISTGYYSVDNGVIWNEFTSGNRITGLPEVNNILVSDQAGTSDCELSVAVGIEYLSDPIELAGGSPIIITEASCDESETDGVIEIPEVSGGVEPYTFEIDGNTVELDGNRQISGLNKLTQTLSIIDNTGCSVDFPINNMLAPNQISANVTEINEQQENRCIEQPKGIRVTLSSFTVNNIPGPFTLILNRADDEQVVELPLNLDSNNGEPVFFVGPDYDLNFTFEKGEQYNWTIRTNNSEQSCSTDGTIRIDDGAIIPTFDLNLVDVACFNSNGFIELTNIVANNDFPLFIQISKNGEIRETITYNDFELNDSFTVSTNALLNPDNANEPDGGTYDVVIYQSPEICNGAIIQSEKQSGIIEEPTSELTAELIPEPNLPPGVEQTRNDMNPIPATRETTADGSISIRLATTSGSPNGIYFADLNLIEPIGNNSRSDYTGITVDSVLFGSDEIITFEGLLPGIYEIVFYDEFGCDQNNKIIGKEGDFQITVDFDRRPFIPNIFTPNNDGNNDEFRILNLPDNGAKLVVTNRNGTIIYSDSNYRESNLWDGGDNPDGIYFYQLTVNGTVQTGWVEIMRGRR
ncbi:T9SS type B sorting domain-containing protein [Marivirga tractuosa]|uniref:Uncharacterized protein n=1 Tax=Marivirga tractuosa (strain ATCC 23168 / DSM 4126 / NBRC 15989 / NCIMB 1408 / VKM B-1430 / H-43) TaxID=643867 RepID=E4TR84_MARTH|nr:gliding motility-associated C-terminal domain-containing protein [Marivirga tractuosa]ADR23736.1 hypothetical protein Ftrac_3769 [Marivirga tractuosa DSM 4126]